MELKEQEQITSATFVNFSLGDTPSQHMSSCSLNLEESKDLKESIKILFRDATGCADLWKDVNIKFDDRRSFPAFRQLLQFSGLDWHKYVVSGDNELNDSNLPNRLSHGESLYPNLTSNSNWVMANKYYGRSLSLVQLLRRVQTESNNDFSREQAGMLSSFLEHLIMIQKENRVVAYCFSEHLKRLRNSIAPSTLARSSNAAAADGSTDKFTKHPIYKCMGKHKHLFDSLYIMSRQSIWLLSKLEESHSSSPSFVEESHRILDTIFLFISKFKKSKESLDHYLLHGCWPFVQYEVMELVLRNERLLDDFAKRIKDLQEQGVGRKPVAETLLGCFVYVVNKLDYYYKTERASPSGDICSSLQGPFSEAAKETSVLIKETIEKLNSVRCSGLTGGGSPLGNITLWRILFESSLINLKLDSICEKHAETIELRIRLLDSVMNPHLDQLNASIQQLLTVGENILEEFVAMHRTMAEITYMLGDAFTTGGAGMNDVMSDETSPRTSNKNDKEMDMDFDLAFRWDKHNVLDDTVVGC